jgi:hypothetical protein
MLLVYVTVIFVIDFGLGSHFGMNDITEQKLHFWTLLRMHADSCLYSPFFELAEYGVCLGLRSKVDRWVEEMAEEIPGYLEFISNALFDTLHHFGHKSLYAFKDVDGINHWCILYGPLSFVNSNRHIVPL